MPDEQILDDLFEAARAGKRALPAHLYAQLETQALAAMPVRRRLGFWQVFGGAWGASGMVAATLAGVWIGVAPMNSAASWADPLAYLQEVEGDDLGVSWDTDFWVFEEGD